MFRFLLVFSISLWYGVCQSQTLNPDIAKALHEQNKEHDATAGQNIYFENTVSVYRKDPWIELCTANPDTAAYYSEKSSRNSYYYRTLINTAETNEYFEFARENTEHDTYIHRSRVFKCSFFDPSTKAIINEDTIRCGTFNQRPITHFNFLKLVELLTNRVRGITSFIVYEHSNGIEVIYYSILSRHFEGSIIIGQSGTGSYTEYELYKNSYTVNKASGEVYLTRTFVKKSDKM